MFLSWRQFEPQTLGVGALGLFGRASMWTGEFSHVCLRSDVGFAQEQDPPLRCLLVGVGVGEVRAQRLEEAALGRDSGRGGASCSVGSNCARSVRREAEDWDPGPSGGGRLSFSRVASRLRDLAGGNKTSVRQSQILTQV